MLDARHARAADPATTAARHLYARLLHDPEAMLGQAEDFLIAQLNAVSPLTSDLPEDPRQLPAWSRQGSARAARQFRRYLGERQSGAGRRYFSCKSHALYFLRGVAPTKLVDGAWLSGLLTRWDDDRIYPLIRTYLEELGDGDPHKNHVLLYRRLLAAHDCEPTADLSDEHYRQGAIQLSLGRLATDFLPEIIGYNLGYEQLPLHLLITAYELRELGIGPYYFTLHVTVDNAASGHGYKAVHALLELLPRAADAGAFYRRVIAGSKLNELGEGTLSVIDSFDLHGELLQALTAKAEVGAQLHSDRCRIGGRTVCEWLSEPARIPAFLACLVETGWVRPGQDPRRSRFWRLIEGERAAMFGVFSGYERQLIHDWIAGESRGPYRRGIAGLHAGPRAAADGAAAEHADDPDVRALHEELARQPDKPAAMRVLAAAMTPARHHTPAGLTATRRFARLLG